jgi:D-glycero-alpha-D-manno-heptose-7-phosphate kinase
MIISRTPFRISFFGGGTDYPEWFTKNNGSVISTTIDKFCYISLRSLPPFFKYNYRLRYFKKEEVKKISDIKHPSIRESLKYLDFDKNQSLEIVHSADLPALSGLGSSSTFTVSLLHALHTFKNENVTKKQLSMEAIHVERNLIKEKVGSQDQTAAAFGGLNHIVFENNGNLKVNNIFFSKEQIIELEVNSILLFTGLQRKADSIAKDKVKNIVEDKTNYHLSSMMKLTEQALNEIFFKKKLDFKKFGEALKEQWELKKKLSNKVTNYQIDKIFSEAYSKGAYGGKILGAGGGGFVLFLVPKNKQKSFLKYFAKYLHVPFRVDNSGSQIIYYSKN